MHLEIDKVQKRCYEKVSQDDKSGRINHHPAVTNNMLTLLWLSDKVPSESLLEDVSLLSKPVDAITAVVCTTATVIIDLLGCRVMPKINSVIGYGELGWTKKPYQAY